jgi:hypothetical protein
MSKKNSNDIESNDTRDVPALPEDQGQRWIKYGSNVALAIVLVVVLAFLVTWMAQKASARVDTTLGGSLSLKPQTVNVIRDLKQHITLVSLYTRTVAPAQSETDTQVQKIDYAGRVADLLDEYRRKGKNIDVKIIDPVNEPDKREELHQQFIAKYGSQIKSYKDYLDEWRKQYEQIRTLIAQEADRIRPFAGSEASTGDEETPVSAFVRTISEELPQRLQDAKDAVDRELAKRHPDFKAATTTARSRMELVSQLAGSIIDQTPAAQKSKSLPEAFKKYLADATPRYQQIKKMADDMMAKADKLGELKVNQLEDALNVENPILVLGDNEWRIIPFRQVWVDDPDVKQWANGAKVAPRFAGEQQVTTAIYSLENPKKIKVVFVRPGGQPLTSPGFPPFVAGGPLSAIADRLRDYNFEVLEKDLSGTWAMQAQMQRMPSPPEPSDEEIKDGIWVVLDVNMGEQPNMPSPPIGAKVAEHLAHGGSALILADPRGDNLASALKDWGVELHPDAIAVHETIKLNDSAASSDPMEEAKARPYIFDCRDYGNHPIANAVKNLDSVLVGSTVIRTHDAKGATVTPLLPLSANLPGLKTWGETDIDSLEKGTVEYNEGKDMAPPIYAGAAVEKTGGGRVVVIGSVSFMSNRLIRIPDPNLLRRGILVNRFPGNLEFSTNSFFWLAHLDTMIAISPTAMDVSRIGDMSGGMLKLWHIGVLLILLPGCVIAAGLMVYANRRD